MTASRIFWGGITLTITLLALLLSGCTNGFAPTGAQQFTPPLSYRQVYAEAKACTGFPPERARRFDALTFYSVPNPFWDVTGDAQLAGYYGGDGAIYIHEGYLDQAWVVKHEMIHSLGYKGHPPVFEECRATWETHDTTRVLAL